MELIHLLAVTPLAFSLFPTVFAGCLPRSTSDRRLLDHTAFTVFLVLHSRPSTGRASLAPSLSLIGPLTLVPPRDSVSPPEVTRCSSVPCRPQSPWYGGWMRTPSPSWCRLDRSHLWPTGSSLGDPIDYGPELLLMPFGFHLAMDTLPSGDCKWWLQVRLGCIRLSSSCPFRHLHTFHFSGQRGFQPRFRIPCSSSEHERDFNPPDQRAAQHAPRSYLRLEAYGFVGLSEGA